MNKSALVIAALIAALQATTATFLYLMFGLMGLVGAYLLVCAIQIGAALAFSEKADRSSPLDNVPVVVGILSSLASRKKST